MRRTARLLLDGGSSRFFARITCSRPPLHQTTPLTPANNRPFDPSATVGDERRPRDALCLLCASCDAIAHTAAEDRPAFVGGRARLVVDGLTEGRLAPLDHLAAHPLVPRFVERGGFFDFRSQRVKPHPRRRSDNGAGGGARDPRTPRAICPPPAVPSPATSSNSHAPPPAAPPP